MLVFSPFFPLFLHYCLCFWYFHGLRQRNKFVIHVSPCDVVFMVLPLRPFHAYPHRFVGLNNTSIFRLVLFNCATGFRVLKKLKSTRHCCWHRNFQLSTSIFLFRLNSSSSGSMKNIPRNLLALSSFGFSMAHFLLFFAFRCIRQMLPYIWPHIVGSRGRQFSCDSPPGPCLSIRWSLIQYNESCETCLCI